MSGLQKHGSGSGCSLCSPHLSPHSSGGPAADGHQQYLLCHQRCTGDQTQVGGQTCSRIHIPEKSLNSLGCWLFMYDRKLQDKTSVALLVICRYNRLDYLYLNAGIMPNPQFDLKGFFKGLFSRYTVDFRCS